jgi:hypothetical protein
MLSFYAAEVAVKRSGIILPAKFNIYKRQTGWHQLAPELAKLYEGRLNYVFDDRLLMFKSIYYSPIELDQAYSWNPNDKTELQFDSSNKLENAIGKDFILISTNRRNPAIEGKFKRVGSIKRLKLVVARDKQQDIYWIKLHSFKGY